MLAPTGSGKTLTAFLWSLDVLFRELRQAPEPEPSSGGRRKRPADEEEGYRPGVRVLYVSPLKALNNDVERNLQIPLAGVRGGGPPGGGAPPCAAGGGAHGRYAAGRPPADRQAPAAHPDHDPGIALPDAQPPSARRRCSPPPATVIVDEIHTLVGTKRRAQASALSLERLERLSASRAGPAGRKGQ